MSNDLLSAQQSAYRPYHSTETAALRITSDIFHALDDGEVCLLSFLDLSSAFDSVDHTSLIQKLHLSYGLSGQVLSWFRSFTHERTMSVCVNLDTSPPSLLNCGVPQGSVLGPLLFILYISDLVDLVTTHGLSIHLFADDVQIYGSCVHSNSSVLSSRLSLCLDDVIDWFNSHRLLLNADKTEILWCSSKPKKRFLLEDPIRIGSSYVAPSTSVRVLGLYIDSHLSFDVHITRCVSTCFSFLRQIRSIRRSLNRPLLISLVSSLVLSRLDYCVSVLSGVNKAQLQRLQSVLNASVRLIFSSSRFSHVTPYLRLLQFLPPQARIDYRLCILLHNCLHEKAPLYLSSEFQKLSDVQNRPCLRSASSARVIQPRFRRPTLGGRAFPVAAAKVWNSLPCSLTSIVNTSVFKKEAKMYFLERSF